jgi:large subunit ribosomal protein L6
MSRLGKTPVTLPKGVEVKALKDGILHIKGAKGTTELKLPSGLSLKTEGSMLLLERDEVLAPSKAEHGLYRSLLKNAIIGVSDGFEEKLVLIGVGYKANIVGTKVDLALGFSHPTALDIPKNIQVVVEKGTTIFIKGIDKREVGQFAAAIRAMKKPEPYKGKGIRYEKEFVRKKEGKAAKGKA